MRTKRINRPVFSKTQRWRFKQLPDELKDSYVESFLYEVHPIKLYDLRQALLKTPPKYRYFYNIRDEIRLSKRVDRNHIPFPIKQGQWRGVEIECLIPEDGFYSEPTCETFCENHEDNCCNCGCEHDCDGGEAYTESFAQWLKDKGIPRVTVKHDGSIRDKAGYFGIEISCLFTTKNRENLKQLCRALNEIGAIVNKSCGLHVHFDQRQLNNEINVKKAFSNAQKLKLNLPFLASLVPASRRNNDFCKLGISKLQGSRYYAVNMCALKKFGTIEIRLHSGTTDFLKISHWVDILEIIVSNAKPKNPVTSLDQFLSEYTVPEYLIEYMQHRIQKFSTLIKVNQYAARPAEEQDERLLQGA